MVWEIEFTDEFEGWWQQLDSSDQENIRTAVAKLQERGPALSRPLADTLEGSRYPNLKELRPLGSTIRILFAFDPRRTAILLLGGDKSGRWEEWYEEMIPEADRLYEVYLEELRREGELK